LLQLCNGFTPPDAHLLGKVGRRTHQDGRPGWAISKRWARSRQTGAFPRQGIDFFRIAHEAHLNGWQALECRIADDLGFHDNLRLSGMGVI
jgi:hypothetical protein